MQVQISLTAASIFSPSMPLTSFSIHKTSKTRLKATCWKPLRLILGHIQLIIFYQLQ